MSTVSDLDEATLSKFIDNCPKCERELKPYTVLPGLSPAKAYCPSCDILRISSSIPVLCTNCNSTKYYNENRYEANMIDGLVVKKWRRLYNKKSVFKGKLEYREDLDEENKNKLIEEIKELQKRRPKEICWYCGSTDLLEIKSEELFRMEKSGQLKVGYRISNRFVPVKHDCGGEPLPALIKTAKTTYRATCGECGYEEYFLVPERQQEEIREIKPMKNEGNSLDIITLEDLEMTQVTPVIGFSSDKDLFEKIDKIIEERIND